MIWTAFILGFAGSLHCLGMCSPLAMAVTNMSPHIIMSRLLYNVGRIITYGLMGAVIATVGMAFPLIQYQNLLSILLGISLLTIGITGVSAIRIPFLTRGLGSFSAFLKRQFSTFLQNRSYGSTFILGSLNGILPCGLSFLALTYCLTLTVPAQGFIFMIVFGIGTLPVMMGLTSVVHWLIKRWELSVFRVTTGMMILSGILLIGRVFIIHLPHAENFQEGVVDIVLCR